jgi:hypothetical protein
MKIEKLTLRKVEARAILLKLERPSGPDCYHYPLAIDFD